MDFQVVHLKKYYIFKLFENDFIVPYGWAKIFMEINSWKQFGKGSISYAHSQLNNF